MLRFADCCSFLHTGTAWQSYECIQTRHWRSWKLSPEVLVTSSAYFLKTHVLPLPLGSFATRPSPVEGETTLRAKPKELPHKDSEGEGSRITSVLEQRPKESSNEEPLGTGLEQYI